MVHKIKCSHILVKKQSEAIAILETIKEWRKFFKFGQATFY